MDQFGEHKRLLKTRAHWAQGVADVGGSKKGSNPVPFSVRGSC